MAELVPIPFENLLRRIYYEFERNDSIFDLPSRKFHRPSSHVDMSILFCGNKAATPLGPAAGPQTQLAQNIVLSWLAGSRILELKTVQIKDRLELSRPCIDMATVGYNTEWSQELRLEESLHEYVKASMLVEILKQWLYKSNPRSQIPNPNLDTIFDVSVGYDLAGIRTPEICRWLITMRNARQLIEEFRQQIPAEFKAYSDSEFKLEIANSITLSTFHGTPADEIERICEFLLTEMDYHVIIKMNPPMLGKERLEYLLHDRLGYSDVEVHQKVYDVNITFPDAVDVARRLQDVAARQGKTLGVKFGNTLEVLNKGKFLKDQIQYLSGQPLHVLHLALVDEWRKVFGAGFPISFSAGVDANNFADCVSMGLAPVTTCTDLLRPGGYGRLPQYLLNLERRMREVGASTVNEFIANTARRDSKLETIDHAAAIVANTSDVLAKSIDNPRYHAQNNRTSPRKIGSHLHLWDCINCDKCVPVCPNDANFYFEIEPVEILYNNIKIMEEGWTEAEGGVLEIKESHQIATFADACNDCGNCDVFCPEDGGPYIEKPRFFGSLDVWRRSGRLGGFVLTRKDQKPALYGRFKDKEYELCLDEQSKTASFHVDGIAVSLDWNTFKILDIKRRSDSVGTVINMGHLLSMGVLMKGMLDTGRVHFVNVGIIA